VLITGNSGLGFNYSIFCIWDFDRMIRHKSEVERPMQVLESHPFCALWQGFG
jgi:hypothetical protein